MKAKLQEQLGGQAKATIQLMAEVMAVYFGFAARHTATPDHKRDVINKVLALHENEWEVDGLVAYIKTLGK